MHQPISRSELSRMLGIALIDIRATKSLKTAHALADIFHNVPTVIFNKLEPEEALQHMRERARRNGLQD